MILLLDLNLTIKPRPIVTIFWNSLLLWINNTMSLCWTISSRSRGIPHPHQAAQKEGRGVQQGTPRDCVSTVEHSSCFAPLRDQVCALVTIAPLLFTTMSIAGWTGIIFFLKTFF